MNPEAEAQLRGAWGRSDPEDLGQPGLRPRFALVDPGSGLRFAGWGIGGVGWRRRDDEAGCRWGWDDREAEAGLKLAPGIAAEVERERRAKVAALPREDGRIICSTSREVEQEEEDNDSRTAAIVAAKVGLSRATMERAETLRETLSEPEGVCASREAQTRGSAGELRRVA